MKTLLLIWHTSTYVSPIGIFLAGYQIDGAWGTVFGDTSMPTPKIGYLIKVGNVLRAFKPVKIPMAKKATGHLMAPSKKL